MFEFQGRVYASKPTGLLKVVGAKVVDDLCMLVVFNTGETRLFDASELLSCEAFKPLEDRAVFESFSIDHGAITWNDGAIDIAPEGLYRRSFEYAAPPRAAVNARSTLTKTPLQSLG
ncbi:DUF2442 domain-containing protein [Eggerthellaceae bacterium zg-887]|uniref:DUF2442 domain-containing protein n=1 Tax=Xiamenia xianingshaonis TaxID=2682776 RepID=UPI00140D89F2|nr:DUF2442 domain-containing protein [Xiamenia xianingshaonis]NHM15759.1 DUF2442 domain-containing protein [Xiamenia xianingshaonis]